MPRRLLNKLSGGRKSTGRSQTMKCKIPSKVTCSENSFDPSNQSIQALISRAKPVRAGGPVEIREFDRSEEMIVVAFDPELTDQPVFRLVPGPRDDEKMLTMNGAHILRVHNAKGLALSEICVIETPLP